MRKRLSSPVRTVALFEAAKGLLVVLAGFGALSFIHHDAQRLAERLVGHLHLNPAFEYPRIFIEFAGNLTDARLSMLGALAAAYAAVRFIEAYGLWLGRRWAEWFAAVSGGIYIPFEVYELFYKHSLLSLALFLINVVIVWFMVIELMRGRE